MWVGGCVIAPVAWPSPPGRRRRSVHRLAKMTPRCHFGAFVYTVATRFAKASTHTNPRRALKDDLSGLGQLPAKGIRSYHLPKPSVSVKAAMLPVKKKCG